MEDRDALMKFLEKYPKCIMGEAWVATLLDGNKAYTDTIAIAIAEKWLREELEKYYNGKLFWVERLEVSGPSDVSSYDNVIYQVKVNDISVDTLLHGNIRYTDTYDEDTYLQALIAAHEAMRKNDE